MTPRPSSLEQFLAEAEKAGGRLSVLVSRDARTGALTMDVLDNVRLVRAAFSAVTGNVVLPISPGEPVNIATVMTAVEGAEPAVKKALVALDLLRQMDFRAAWTAIETHDYAGELQTIEDVMKIVGVFVPAVAQAEDILEIVGPLLVLAMKYGKPVQPGDPAYELPAGNGAVAV